MTFHASPALLSLSVRPVTRPTLSHFVNPSSNILFSLFYPAVFFPAMILVVTRYSSFSLLITWTKVAWRSRILLLGGPNSFYQFFETLFRLISLQSIRIVVFYVEFLLYLFFSCPGLASILKNRLNIAHLDQGSPWVIENVFIG